MAAEVGSMSQLPDIIEGKGLLSPRNSTSSLTKPSRPPSCQEQAALWAIEIRQVLDDQMRVSLMEVLDEDVERLKQELVALFIVALQQDSRPSWQLLREVINILIPYRELLQGKPDMCHYLERVIHHINVHHDRLKDIRIVDAMKKVFPQEVKKITQLGKGPARNYTAPLQPRHSTQLPTEKSTIGVRTPRIMYPEGQDPFRMELPLNESKIKPKALTFRDLRASLPAVAKETANRESIWGHSLGLTAQALSTDLLEEMIRQGESRRTRKSDAMSVISEEKLGEEVAESEAPQEVHHTRSMTGREAVEYFTRCYHTGKIRFMYFNIAPNRHYCPYDLCSTQKHKAKPEHYVFSTFGVLHVHPDTQSESMSLTDWQREAVLWEATSNVPFFKDYLKMKMFRRWKENIDYKRFLKTVDNLSVQLLASVPLFGVGLIQLSRILQELLTLKFLPIETTKMYELGDFENIVTYKTNQAEKVLEKFYRYSRLILDTTVAECHKKLRYCEAQVQHKTVFSKDSLHIQRVKKEQREDNLKKAKEEMARLPDMMKLVHQIVLSHLVQIARSNTELFVGDVMRIGQVAQREGLFKVHLVFNEMNSLTINPDKGKFSRSLSKALEEIPMILCEAAEVITDENRQDVGRKSRSLLSTPSTKKEDLGPLSDTTRRTALVPQEEERSQEMWDSMTEGDADFDTESGWNTPSDVRLETPKFDDVYDRGSQDGEFGIATPDLVIRYEPNDSERSDQVNLTTLIQPLSQENLEEKLKLDKDYKKALKIQEELMHESLLEIDQYCEDNGWLIEIYQFCSQWSDKTVVEYRNVAAFNIEQKLTEIRQWIERVRNFDLNFKTTNGIFFVNCCGVHDLLVPKLNHIYKEMVTFIAREARKLAQGFVDEMNSIIKNLQNKDTALDKFAKYSKNVHEYKKNMISYQQRSDYIKSLFEVIRMCYRQLKPEEEKLEEQVQSRWEAFLFHIQDANEFLSIQTPLVTAKLEDTYKKRVDNQMKGRPPVMTGLRRFSVVAEGIKQNIRNKNVMSENTLPAVAKTALEMMKNPSDVMKLEEEANRLCIEATTGKYLDPKSEALPLLKRLKEILQRFYRVKSELLDIGHYKEDITGESYDTSYLRELQSKIEVRNELWKYLDVSVNAIKDWKKVLFKKMHVKKVFEKINEWQAAAVQIKRHIPVDDAVLKFFYRHLQDFKHELPLLYKLSSDALKERHWKTIFIGMGEQYDPHWKFTVEDLLSYNLGQHSLLINTVYQGAVAEYDLEQKLNRVKKYWEEKQFKLAKHIPDSVYAQEKKTDSLISPRKLTRVEKFRQERTKSAESGGLDLKRDDLYTLIEIEELKYMLEDSSVTLQSMLVSPFLAELRPEAERWDFIVHELEEIIDSWHTCQKKWLYLLKVFEDADVFEMFGKHSKKFKAVNKKFKDFMSAVADDPRVLSVVTKRRGEKGFKLLSGDVLKNMFSDLIQDQEEVLKHLDKFLDKARMGFPRLYFLSDQELVDLLGISRSPQALVPYVQKCFPGIENLTFALPETMEGMHTALDFALNAHVMEVTALHGILGETVPLTTRIEAMTNAPKWLSKLELTMKTTMSTVLQACVLARLDEGSAQPQVLQLLDEVAQLEEMGNSRDITSIKDDIRHTFEHWLLRFPSQSVLVAEGVLFEQKVHLALQQKNIDGLAEIRENLRSRIEQYSHILREICADYLYSETKQRLHALVGNLINQTMHHRDILEALVSCPDISETMYDWSKVLKYHMDMTSILRAKTELCDPDRIPPKQSSSFVRSSEGARDKIKETGRELTTTVTSTYDLGQCLMHQLGYVHLYDHEYLGLNRHLIFTPLTERAYLTLSIALKNFNCGTLMGPAATGKSETIRDLSQSLGRHLVTVNCCETVSIPTITQYLNGIIQAGSWVLFDDCERLDKGVMSVFAQHLDYLRAAYKMMDKANDSQYKVRGTAKADVMKPRINRTRRHSLTTLHPMPGNDMPSLERQATVPHGFNEQGLHTYFEDTWIKERERRHSIGAADNLKEAELYPTAKPPSLFQEVKFETAAKKVEKKRNKVDFRQLATRPAYKPAYFSNLLFNGKLIKARANFGCFMTMNTQGTAYTQIPECLKLQMRSCALVSPDVKVILEMTLFCCGFSESKKLTEKLFLLWDMMQTQLSKKPQYALTLRTLKTILSLADRKLRARRHLHEAIADAQSIGHSSLANMMEENDDMIEEDTSESPPPTVRPASAFSFTDETGREEYALIYGLMNALSPKMQNENDALQMKNLIRDVFPQSTRPKSGVMSYDPGLVSAIQEQMAQDNLQATTEHVNKILQLYSAIQMKQGVILIGPCGSGKTTSYQTLARALNNLHCKKLEKKELDELKVEQAIFDSSRQKVKVLRESVPRVESKITNKWKRISSGLGAINFLYMGLLDEKADDICYPKVDLSVLAPNVFSTEELFGFFKDGIWQQGLLAKLVKTSEFQVNSAKFAMENFDEKKNKAQVEPPDYIKKWLVLDGGIQLPWVESLNTLLDDSKTLSLANRETSALKIPTSLLFEMNDLTNASPAMLTRCALVNLGDTNVHWKSLVESWGVGAKQKWLINTSSFRVILEMAKYIFTLTLKFFAENCSYSLTADTGVGHQVVSGVQEVTSFLNILSSLLDRHYLREEWEKTLLQQSVLDVRRSPRSNTSVKSRGSSRLEEHVPNYISTIKSMFAYAYVWGFGGILSDKHVHKFDELARESLYRAAHPVSIPRSGTVYDYHVDFKTGALVKWEFKQDSKGRSGSQFIATAESERYGYLVELLLNSNHPVLLNGAPGVGKTSLVESVVQNKHQFTRAIMSPGLTPASLQNLITMHVNDLRQRRGQPTLPGLSSTRSTSHHLFFLDDLNTATKNHGTGCQPPLELLRQLLTYKGIFDTERKVFIDLHEAAILAACTNPGTPGSGCGTSAHILPPRLARLFTTVTVMTPSDEGLHNIYGKCIRLWLEEFPTYSVEHHGEFAKAMMQGIIDLYKLIQAQFRPTPAQAHYMFSLHDLAHVVQGILLMSPRSRSTLKSKKKVGKKASSSKRVNHQVSTMSAATDLSETQMEKPPMMRVIARLWCHEVTRTFGDRLTTAEDADWFKATLHEVVNSHFCSTPEDMWKSDLMASIREETHSQLLTPLQKSTTPGRDTPASGLTTPSQTAEGIKVPTPPPGAKPRKLDSPDSGPRSVHSQSGASSSLSSHESEIMVKPGSAPVHSDSKRSPVPDTVLQHTKSETGKGTAEAKMSEAGKGVSEASKGVPESEKQTSTEPEESTETETTSKELETSETDKPTEITTDVESSAKTEEGSRPPVQGVGSARSVKFDQKTSGGDKSEQMPEGNDDEDDDDETESSEESETESEDSDDSVDMTSGEVKAQLELIRTSKLQEINKPGTPGHLSIRTGSSDSIGGKGTLQASSSSLRSTSTGGGIRRGRRGVTFKSGLVSDRDDEEFLGPLFSMDQIKDSHEELTGFLFNKSILTCYTESTRQSVEKGYVEVTTEQLEKALKVCLGVYNEGTLQKLDLVFFQEAVEHITRLSRVLTMQSGNALVLGVSYSTGRATMTRLAAYIAKCKLFEPKPQQASANNREVTREMIKLCCQSTSLQGRPSVLLIHEDLGEESLLDVCSLMSEGTCPDLYSPEELQDIVVQMTPGSIPTKRVDKIEQTFEKFRKRVQQNLHVVVCLSYTGSSYQSLHDKLKKFPSLIKNCCSVDLYQPWSRQAFVKIAHQWLLDRSASIKIPWSREPGHDQMRHVSHAMSYIHESARLVVEKQYSHMREPLRSVTPLTFMELTHLFRVITACLVKSEQANIDKHKRALKEIDVAQAKITSLTKSKAKLRPKLEAANEAVEGHVKKVEKDRVCYIEALEKCQAEEKKLEKMMGPLSSLKESAQAEFNRINPIYYAALNAMKHLSISDFAEIKSFNAPPEVVKEVVDMICVMFEKPPNWETGKLLLLNEGFFNELEFYDKDNIPPHIYNEMCKFVENPRFSIDAVRCVNKATSALTSWIHSIYHYAMISQAMKPRLAKLLDAEGDTKKAQAALGAKRIEASKSRGSLEQRIQAHKEAVKQAKGIEKQIAKLDQQIQAADDLMEQMETENILWKEELASSEQKIQTAVGDALIAAASICYFGPLDSENRANLLSDWLARCEAGNFDVKTSSKVTRSVSRSTKLDVILKPSLERKVGGETSDGSKLDQNQNRTITESGMEMSSTDTCIPQPVLPTRTVFCLEDIFSSFEEQCQWRLKHMPTDLHAVQNALIMRACCQNRYHVWPLLIDPDRQAKKWVEILQKGKSRIRENLLTPVNMTTNASPSGPLMPGISYEDVPPSRGTAITACTDMSDYSLGESISLTESSSNFKSQAAPTTPRVEDLRPVTTLMQGTLSELHIDEEFTHPPDNLWVVEADDQSLDGKMINAIVYGVTVLVTNLERKPLDPLFRTILLRQFTVNESGEKVVRVGEREFVYHPDFCLYLSTSVPLYITGDGIGKLPLQKMCVIDLTISPEGITQQLLAATLKYEKPEFAGQERSLVSDIIHQKYDIAAEHDKIMEKTLGLESPLLDDPTMLESLLNCQENTEKCALMLDETEYLQEQLEDKESLYIPVAENGSMVYRMLRNMAAQNALYHIPSGLFVKIFAETVELHQRGKFSTGVPKGRTRELTDATTAAIFKFASMLMSESDAQLFALMITIETMKSQAKLTHEEYGLFVNGLDGVAAPNDQKEEERPDWLTQKCWLDCLKLESICGQLQGLPESLTNHSTPWKEYFKLPVALMNCVADDKFLDLSIFQKVLVWKFCCPQRLFDVCQALVLHQLGGNAPQSDNYDVRDIYPMTACNVPVVFVMPPGGEDVRDGYSLVSPAIAIQQYAKENKLSSRVKVLNFGTSAAMEEAKKMLEFCMESGDWLVLQNTHLVEAWSQDVLKLIRNVITSESRPESSANLEVYEMESVASNKSAVDDGKSMMGVLIDSTIDIHRDFRLWVVGRTDTGTMLPGVITQYSLKVSTKLSHSLKNILQRYYAMTEKAITTWEKAYQDPTLTANLKKFHLPLTILQSVLLHRRAYGNIAFSHAMDWSHGDFVTALLLLKQLVLITNESEGIVDLLKLVYGGPSIDGCDKKVIEAVIAQIVHKQIAPTQKVTDELPTDLPSLLSYLEPTEEETFSKRLEELVEVSSATLGLSKLSGHLLCANRSRALAEDIKNLVGSSQTLRRSDAESQIIKDILKQIENLPELPPTTRDHLYPLEIMLHYEVESYKTLLSTIQSGLTLLDLATQGAVALCQEQEELYKTISQNDVPKSWEADTFPSGLSLDKWLYHLEQRVELITVYAKNPGAVAVFDLAVFRRPDKFIQCILQNHSRKSFRDLHTFRLEAQFLPMSSKPFQPPTSGVYVTNLQLHNASWDGIRSVLKDQPADQDDPRNMPTIWLKPVEITDDYIEQKHNFYDCPIYLGGKSGQLLSKNVVTHLKLQTAAPPMKWETKRVYMSCDLN
ncbi:dynein axonemal heavy chain 6-like isoform X2 [Lineus longissimus]|uniref:dynein axonemal heavy chain 6-like isoform X2 n=1 Tax=Lineus longissimus TaxID=88925 RepID=UPI00315E008F